MSKFIIVYEDDKWIVTSTDPYPWFKSDGFDDLASAQKLKDRMEADDKYGDLK